MNSRAINFIKNFSYSLSSNLISMFISVVVTLIVPKLIGVEEYGFWQLYLFYSSYVGFLHFGWNDGIYLRYGGKNYEELDKRIFFTQFYMLIILQLIIATIICGISNIVIVDVNKIVIFEMTALCMLIVNTRCMLLYILQLTNKIKAYANITIMDRMLYFFLIVVFLLAGVRDYKIMIVADLSGRLISLLYAMYCCKDIVFRRISTFYFSFRETIENISVGIKLMFASIASMFIIGVVRFGIEHSWDVSTFGKVSLTLSVSNLMMLLINAVGIIMFPILRRINKKGLPSIYTSIRDLCMVVMLGALIVYYPLKVILSIWLPKYSSSLMYMALLFPMCIYEGKMALLINTYLKTLRKEKLMLKINLISLVISLGTTYVTTLLLKNLDLAIVSIVILLAFRCILSEVYLSTILKISLCKDIFLESIMTLIFILTGYFINSWLTVFLYSVSYLIYLFTKQEGIAKTVNTLKQLMKV